MLVGLIFCKIIVYNIMEAHFISATARPYIYWSYSSGMYSISLHIIESTCGPSKNYLTPLPKPRKPYVLLT